MAGLLTYNGVPLILPDAYGELQHWLRQFQTIDEIIAFCGIETATIAPGNAPRSDAGTGLPLPNYPPLPKPEVNRLIMPTGATRFGYFFGFVPKDTAEIGALGSTGSLVISDGTNSQTVSLQLLAYRPVAAVGNLWLVVFVDARYGWQFLNAGNILTFNGYPNLANTDAFSGTPNNDYGQNELSWSGIFASIEGAIGTTINRDDTSGFLVPDVLELSNRKNFNVAQLLEAVAQSCGLRVWVGFDGTVYARNGSASYATNFNDVTNMIAGGLAPSEYPQPATVLINYRRASQNRAYADHDTYTLTQTPSGGASGSLVIESACYAHWSTLPDNYINPPDNFGTLSSLASNIAAGVIQWWERAYDATFLGVKSWTQTGYDNYLSFGYAISLLNDAEPFPVVADAPRDPALFDENLRSFTTRIQSMPVNFGGGINLSQDPSVRFLRGLQWGKLAAASVPPRTVSGKQVPSRTAVDIWQLNANLAEQSTGIRIQAYDADGGASVLPIGTRVVLWFHEVNRSWLYQVLDDELAIVQVTSETPNALCLWPAKLVTVGTKNPFCSTANYTTGATCWLALFDQNTAPKTSLDLNERFLAKLIGTKAVSPGTALQVYAAKSDSGSRVEIVQTDGTDGTITPNGQCVFSGSLFKASPQASAYCSNDPWNVDAAIWLAPLTTTNSFQQKSLRANTKYIGKYLGKFAVGTDSRPLYAIQDAGDKVDVVRITNESGSTAVSNMAQKNATCLWTGNIVKTNLDYPLCSGAQFQPQASIFVAIVNNDGEVTNYLTTGDRHIGLYVGQYALATDSRPLYVIKEQHHLIRFQLILPMVCGSSTPANNALQLLWNGNLDQYVLTSQAVTVVDPYIADGGMFEGFPQTPYQIGYRGYAEWKPDRQVYEIVFMQRPAQWIRFKLDVGQTLALDSTSVTAKVLQVWGGKNPDPQNVGLLVYQLANIANGQFFAPAGAVGLACYNDYLNRYDIVCVQTWPLFIIGTLTSTINAETGAATGTATYSWGPQAFIPVATVSLIDKTSPQLFTGEIGDQFQATLSAFDQKYIFTWVQCQRVT